MSYKKTVMRAARLVNKTYGEQIGEQIGGEQITVVIYIGYLSICSICIGYI